MSDVTVPSRPQARLAALVLLAVTCVVLLPVWAGGAFGLLRGMTRSADFDWVITSSAATLLPVGALFLLATDGRTLRAPIASFPWRHAGVVLAAFLVGAAILARVGLGFYEPRDPAGIVGFLLISPFVEELLFRGALYELVGERGSGRRAHVWAIYTTAVVFALAHFGGYRFQVSELALRHVGLMVPTGMFFAWLRARSGSIWPSTVAHGLTNLVWLLL
jgi:membrane protease YdiL (CAAX protease family)